MDNEAIAQAQASGRRDRSQVVRVVGAIALSVIALAVMVGMAPKDTVTQVDLASVMEGDSVNQESATSAPQQSVVNGWTARDLLELIATQEMEARDDRPAVLLTLLVLGLSLTLATSSPVLRRQDDAELGGRPQAAPESG